MQEILRILEQWPAARRGGAVERVSSPQSFSGASVWRVEAAGELFALRQWQERMDANRVASIHNFQSRLVSQGLRIIPVLQRTARGETVIADGGRLWELAAWMPGAADFWRQPNSMRLQAAMRALATIHCAAMAGATPGGTPRRQPSASLQRRAERLNEIVTRDGDLLRQRLDAIEPSAEVQLARDALALVAMSAPRQRVRSWYWRSVDLPQHWRLGDVHHDHILFTGDEVTGVIDFGAADYDSPAGDVARLLGSLIGDDRRRWLEGLAAYQTIRPLTPDETAAVDFCDASGTVISAANWIGWLWPQSPQSAPQVDRAAAVERLRRLLARLQALSQRTGETP